MNRVAERVAGVDGAKLLIPFFTAGYPDMKASLDYAKAAADAGADIIELGMPFSDPLADGPAIQYSSHQALQAGVNLRSILKGVEQLRRTVDLPVILMGYLNPMMAYGMNKFLRQAARAGVDGFIIPDLPVDDATDYLDAMQANRLSVVFLVAPTSPPERIKAADMNSSDFVYAVTVTGVTGTGRKFSRSTDRYLRQLRRLVSKPYVAGFGVSSPESAQRLCRYADGVVIGSALVKLIRDSGNKGQARRDIARFLSSVRKAI